MRDHLAHARADIALAESEILLIDIAISEPQLAELPRLTLQQLRGNAQRRIEWANKVLERG